MKINQTYIKLQRMGLKPRATKGEFIGADTMFSIFNHDGVQYSVDDLGMYESTGDSSSLIEAVLHVDPVVERHHLVIKKVMEFVKQYTNNDTWVTVNPGLQLSVTFGDKSGPSADMLLSFPDEESVEEFKQELREMGELDSELEKELEEMSISDEFLIVVTNLSLRNHFSKFKEAGVVVKYIDDEDLGFFSDDEEGDN